MQNSFADSKNQNLSYWWRRGLIIILLLEFAVLTFFVDRNLFISLNGFSKIYMGTDADLFDRIKKTEVTMMETSLQTYIYHHEMQDSITNKLYLDIQSFKE